MQNRDWTRRSKRAVAPALLLIAAILIGVPGSTELPLEAHEAFVVQTTREMAARGDWILPWFNGVPRLKKPPMSYWLTGLVSGVSGSPREAQPVHARTVSFLAGVGLLAVAWTCGLWLFDRRTGTLAVLLLLTSRGFFMYTHDGRPDLLYAFFCGAALSLFILAWRPYSSRHDTWAIYGMWLCYALATLTKGPHVPAAFLAATVIFARRDLGSWAGALRLHRIPGGLMLFLLLTVPWWFAVQQRLGGGGLAGTQLTGSLLTLHPSQFLNFFYFYQSLMLLLPWLLLVPFAVLAVMRARDHSREHLLLLLWVGVPLLMLSVGPQQRVIYMLPCLVPLCLLLARGAIYMVSMEHGKRWPLVAVLFVLLQALVPLAVMTWLVQQRMQFSADPVYAVGGLFAILVLAWIARQARRLDVNALVLLVSALLTAGYLASNLTLSAWSVERFDLRRLAFSAKDAAGSAPIVAWKAEPDAFTYYTGRTLLIANSVTEFRKLLNAAPQKHLVVITQQQMLSRIGQIAPIVLLDTEQRASPRSLVVASVGQDDS